jgi:hypothetical protein
MMSFACMAVSSSAEGVGRLATLAQAGIRLMLNLALFLLEI